MSHDQGNPSPAADISAPTATDFDQAFSAATASPGLRRVWEVAAPDLPPEVEPFSFVSASLLRHVAQALGLSPGQTLVDLGCGRGGPGLWLAREADVSLVGVDFSSVAIDQAEMQDRAEWHDLYTRVYQVALDLGDPRDDTSLADLQDEARQRLPMADLMRRVVVTANAPDRPRAAPSGQGPDPGMAR